MSFDFSGSAFQDNPFYNSEPVLGPAPRDIKLTPIANIIRTIVLIVVVAFAVVAPITAVKVHMQLADLRDEGLQVSGTITNKYQTNSKYGTASYLGYSYAVGGTQYTDDVNVRADKYDAETVGSRVPIYVLLEQPAYHHFGPVTKDDIDSLDRKIINELVFGLVIVGLLSYGTSRRMHLECSLLQNGTAAQARINGISNRPMDIFSVLLACFQGSVPITSLMIGTAELYAVTCHYKSGNLHVITTMNLHEA